MVIINPTVPSQPAAVNRPAGPAPVIPADRVMMATVLGERATHLYELASGSLRLMAESQTPLRSGEELRLLLSGRDQQQRPTLRILNPPTNEVTSHLRQILPQQRPLPQAMALLAAAATLPPHQPASLIARTLLSQLPLPEHLVDANGLRRQLQRSGMFMEAGLLAADDYPESATPRPQADLKGEILRAMQQLQANGSQHSNANQAALARAPLQPTRYPGGGVLAEAAAEADTDQPPSLAATASRSVGASPLSPGQQLLARGYPPAQPGPDLPGELHPQGRKPLAALPADDEGGLEQRLFNELKSALARIESHQLMHLRQREGQPSSLLVELPVLDQDGVDIWQLQFQWPHNHPDHEPQQPPRPDDPAAPRRWSVDLSFDLPGLGPMQVSLNWQQDTLSGRFHVAKPATLTLVEQHLAGLRDSLQAQGIDSPQLNLQLGLPQRHGSGGLSDTSFIQVTA